MWTIKSNQSEINLELKPKVSSAFSNLLQREDIGFYNATILKKSLKESQVCLDNLNFKFHQVAVLGIGGSSLGAQALLQAISPAQLEDEQIVFFDNVDANSFYRKLKKIKDPKHTLWILISKSGGTVETLSQAEYIQQYLEANYNLALADNSVVITELKESPLYNWATDNGCPILEVPKSIGGRYSVLTPVGLFPALALGIIAKEIIAGAETALNNKLLVEDLVLQFASSFSRQEMITYFFSYCDDLQFMNLWIQQLWSESLGKPNENACMSVPVACRGATDQHSVLQQMMEGSFKKFVCFIRVGQSEKTGEPLNSTLFQGSLLKNKTIGELLSAEAQATSAALKEQTISNLTLFCELLSPSTVGEFFMTMELVVASLGLMYQIDPFNQPGVERGKILTRNILKQ